MPVINTPDGPVQFPDTMSMEQIEAVLREKYPPTANVNTHLPGSAGLTLQDIEPVTNIQDIQGITEDQLDSNTTMIPMPTKPPLSFEQPSTTAQPTPQAAPQLPNISDRPTDYLGKAAGSGAALAEGYLQGIPIIGPWTDEFITDPLAALASGAILGKSPVDQYRKARALTSQRQIGNSINYPIATLTGNIAGGLGGATLAGAVGPLSSAANLITRPIAQKGLLSAGERVLRGAGAGGLTGAVMGAGAANEGDRAKGATTGAQLGAAFGGALSGLSAAGSAAKGALREDVASGISDIGQRLIDKARSIGVEIPADALAQSKLAKRVGSLTEEIPFNQSIAKQKKNAEAISKELGRLIGVNGPVNLDTISEAKNNFSKQYGALESGRMVDTGMLRYKLEQFKANAPGLSDIGEEGAKKIRADVDELLAELGTAPQVKAEVLGTMRRKAGSLLDQARDFKVAQTYGDLQAEIADEIVDTLPGATKEGYQQLKKQYRNFIAVKKAIKGSPEGTIDSPAKLLRSVENVYGDLSNPAAGELGELAMMSKLFNSPRIAGSDTAVKTAIGVSGAAGLGPMLVEASQYASDSPEANTEVGDAFTQDKIAAALARSAVLPAIAIGGGKMASSVLYDPDVIKNAQRIANGLKTTPAPSILTRMANQAQRTNVTPGGLAAAALASQIGNVTVPTPTVLPPGYSDSNPLRVTVRPSDKKKENNK